LKFYDPEHRCSKCAIGDLTKIDISKKQLFACSPEKILENLKYQVKEKIFYPNGEVAFLIIEPVFEK